MVGDSTTKGITSKHVTLFRVVSLVKNNVKADRWTFIHLMANSSTTGSVRRDNSGYSHLAKTNMSSGLVMVCAERGAWVLAAKSGELSTCNGVSFDAHLGLANFFSDIVVLLRVPSIFSKQRQGRQMNLHSFDGKWFCMLSIPFMVLSCTTHYNYMSADLNLICMI